jgi:hypothetical protein
VSDSKVEPDVGLCWSTSPPLVVPLSKRAKGIIKLPENVDCAIFLNDSPEMIMGLFPEDTIIMAMAEDYAPNLIVAMTIKQLH